MILGARARMILDATIRPPEKAGMMSLQLGSAMILAVEEEMSLGAKRRRRTEEAEMMSLQLGSAMILAVEDEMKLGAKRRVEELIAIAILPAVVEMMMMTVLGREIRMISLDRRPRFLMSRRKIRASLQVLQIRRQRQRKISQRARQIVKRRMTHRDRRPSWFLQRMPLARVSRRSKRRRQERVKVLQIRRQRQRERNPRARQKQPTLKRRQREISLRARRKLPIVKRRQREISRRERQKPLIVKRRTSPNKRLVPLRRTRAAK
jgi:hypothetical protein